MSFLSALAGAPPARSAPVGKNHPDDLKVQTVVGGIKPKQVPTLPLPGHRSQQHRDVIAKPGEKSAIESIQVGRPVRPDTPHGWTPDLSGMSQDVRRQERPDQLLHYVLGQLAPLLQPILSRYPGW